MVTRRKVLTLNETALLFGFGDFAQCLDHADRLCPDGLSADGWRAAYLLGWIACDYWDQVDGHRQIEIVEQLEGFDAASHELGRAALHFDSQPGGVAVALEYATPATDIEEGRYGADDWIFAIANSFADGELGDDAEMALNLLCGGLWAVDCLRASASKTPRYLASYRGLAFKRYEGNSESFGPFLFDAYVAGVPFWVNDPDISEFFPTGTDQRSQWFRANDQELSLLADDLITLMSIEDQVLAEEMERRGYGINPKIPGATGQALLHTPLGDILADRAIEEGEAIVRPLGMISGEESRLVATGRNLSRFLEVGYLARPVDETDD